LLPLADGRSSIVWSLPGTRAENLLHAGAAAFLMALQEASDGVLGELGACSDRAGFGLQVVHAWRYGRPRVVLVGDAAHTVHPLAGQGMNLGLLDAACLADVIEQALLRAEDPGDLRILRRYERQRKAENLKMLVALDALHRLFQLPAWTAPARALGLAAVNASPSAKRALMMQALGLGQLHGARWSDPRSGDRDRAAAARHGPVPRPAP
jgi:2-octaprenylphenol hydroxylase